MVSDSQSEFVPFDSQAIDVKERFVPFIPIQHRSGPVIESTENVGHRAKGDSVNFEGFFGHNSTEHVAVHPPGINDVSHIGGDNNVQTYDYPDTPHAKPERRWSVKQTFSDSTPPESIPSVEGFHT